MAIEQTVALLLGNLNLTLPMVVLIFTALGSMIFMAVELRFGLMMLFFMYGIETLVFWMAGTPAAEMYLIVMAFLSSFVLMTLSLWLVNSQRPGGRIL